ncbi:MAG: heme biosynthesis HemY N-terminal domain-containing protein [Gammaproteobacteria bacterium]
MKLLALIIFSLLLAVGIGAYIEDDAGLITVVISGWTIQTSFSFFIISMLVLFLLSHFILRLISRLWRMPRELGRWQENRHQRLSEKYLSRGLMALIEGDWNKAEVSLIKGAPHSQSSLVNYLGAARAAQQLGATERRDDYLLKAYRDDPDAEIAIGLVQAELQIKQQQTEQALATLTRLHDQKPKQDKVKKMLLHTYAELKDWNAMLELLPKIERAGILPREQIQAKQLEAYGGLLKNISLDGDKEKLNNAWLNIPRKIRTEFHLIEVYTEEKLKLSDSSDCEPLIHKALKKQWDLALVDLYGQVEGKEKAKQLKFAEGFLSSHARNSVLLLTLGRLSARNKLWGKARTHLEESIEINPLPETFRTLASVLDELGEHEAATVYYQRGLELATVGVVVADGVKLLGSSDEGDIVN